MDKNEILPAPVRPTIPILKYMNSLKMRQNEES